MSRMRLGIAVLVVAAAIAVVLLRSRRAQAPTTASAHADGIDYRMAPLEAALDAPEGSTPCESAYNSIKALDDASHKASQATPWKQLADRDTFLGRCAKLPAQDQQCLAARYQAHHHDVCDAILPRYTGDSALFEAAAKP
jgi:hypothetical protein